MPSIQRIKLKSGTAYQVTWSVNGKKQKQYFPAGTPLQAVKAFEAKIQSDKLAARLNNNAAGIPLSITKSHSLEQFKLQYVKARQNEIQVNRHAHTFNILISYFGSDYPISQITHFKIDEWKNNLLSLKLEKIENLNWEREQKARRGTNKEYVIARTIFTWAFKKDLINTNPFHKTTPLSAAEPTLIIPTRDQERKFYKQLRKAWSWQARLSYLIMRLQGLRRSEVRALKYRNIDLKNRVIIIEQQKNQKSDMLPIHPVLVRALRMYKHKGYLKGSPNDFIFNYSKDYCTNTFRHCLDRAGLQHIKNPAHIFRHAFVTDVLKQTGNLALTRQLARHSDFNTTKKYLHLLPDDLRKDFDKLRPGKSPKTK